MIHLPAGRGARVPVGHRVERRGAGRLDHHRARAHRGGDRGAPAGRAPQPLPGRRQEQPGPAPAADARRRSAQPRGEPARRRGAPRAGDAVAGSAPPALLHAAAGGGDRPAPGRGDAPGHHVHLQPQRLRRRPRRLPRRRAAAHHPRRARPRPRHRRRAHRGAGRRRPRRARLRPVPRRARDGGGRPPRRDGAAVQGGGGGVLHRGAHEGGVRHRDARPRREHAGSVGRDRAAHQVLRRAPRAPHAGGVHAAHRAGRPAGHRRGRLRHRALVAVRALRAGGRAGLEPHLRAALGVPAHLQHGGQPRAPLPARRGPPPAQPVVRAVPGRQGRRAPRGAHRAPADPARAAARARRAASAATSRSTGSCGRRRSSRVRRLARPAAAGRSIARSRR